MTASAVLRRLIESHEGGSPAVREGASVAIGAVEPRQERGHASREVVRPSRTAAKDALAMVYVHFIPR
jgi:hypothetical protein